MAVFRIEKTRDYTVMSNHHLLSLPEDWNYTTRGLAKICKEGTDSIGSALKELERAGYIVRNRLRDSKGKSMSSTRRPIPRIRASRVRTSRIRIHQVRKDQILSNQAPNPPQGPNGPDGTGCGSERVIGN